MYQALYRKYRPKTFEDVFGQDVIVKTLKNAVINNKLTHAYLFTGPRGTGKTSIAKIFAKIVNCENKNKGIPCDNCKSCIEINKGQNVDIIEIDAASNNGVDEIRELKSKVNLVPAISKYKVYIIDEVHMLTTGAFNALLKTLEEPPAHVIFILATTEPHKIPSTILSRCQRFDFKKISESKISENLLKIVSEEKIKITEESINEIARISDGGMRDAISILDEVIAYAEDRINIDDIHEINGTLTSKELEELLNNIVDHDLESIMTKIDRYNNNGKNFVKLTEEIVNYFKLLLLSKVTPQYFETLKTNIIVSEVLKNKVDNKKLIDMIETFNLTINDMKKSDNPKLVFEIMIIKEISVNNTQINAKIEQELKEVKPKIIVEENKTEIIKKKELPKVDTKIKSNMLKIKEVRIGNTLANFNKKELIEVKSKIEDLRPLVLDPIYSQDVSIILDGELKAASDTNLIFVYNTELESDLFNEQLLKLEQIINENIKTNYKIISTCKDDWEIIKKGFNSKKTTYNYQEETFNLEELLNHKEPTEKIEELFGNVVEYQN